MRAPRSGRLLPLLALLAGCPGAPPPPFDRAVTERGAPDLASLERGTDGPRRDALVCAKAPCAARPILFLHGNAGSNDDWFWLLGELLKSDGRWDAYQLAGREDHGLWAPASVDRRGWLFAFDYYVKLKTDARGSYTAGPGRIGSNSGYSCAGPPGQGHLIADNPAYDQGTVHDYAADLHDFVESVRRATGADSVDVVAHSMGGMVLRSYLAYHGGAARVRRVLLLASPVKGVPLAGLGTLFPVGHPDWMSKHEIAELDGGSLISQVRFLRCGEAEPRSPGAWGAKLLDEELVAWGVELHVMSGSTDLLISYNTAHHPLALSHLTVPADHPGILKRPETLARVKELLGGKLWAARPAWSERAGRP